VSERETPVVLVADDEEDIRMLVTFRLKRAGYDVLEASDGEQALRLATEGSPDVAVLDVMMPKLSGFEVLGELRSNAATSELPVILLTARAQPADVERGLAAGADDYVTKPFSPEELRGRVASLLERP
jgi:DNA-binding response OmpR family regulator